jgi:hypothetical protein
MVTYEGKVLSADKGKDRIDVRKSPATGMKIDALKIGTAIKGDRIDTSFDSRPWMHITDPTDGWVLAAQLQYTTKDSEDDSTPNPEWDVAVPPVTNIQQPTNIPGVDSSKLYKVKTWSSEGVMHAQGFDVRIVKTSNFQAVPLFIEDGSGGGVSSFLNIPREDVEKLKGLQVPDNYNLAQKMNWLCGYRGRIYMYDEQSDNWELAKSIRWGSIALGGNVVLIDDIVEMTAKPPDGIKRKIQMARLVSFRKTDWGKTWQSHPYLIHRAYCCYKPDNKFGDSPKGIIYTPLWSPLDWDFAGQIQPKAWYLPMEWLEQVT